MHKTKKGSGHACRGKLDCFPGAVPLLQKETEAKTGHNHLIKFSCVIFDRINSSISLNINSLGGGVVIRFWWFNLSMVRKKPALLIFKKKKKKGTYKLSNRMFWRTSLKSIKFVSYHTWKLQRFGKQRAKEISEERPNLPSPATIRDGCLDQSTMSLFGIENLHVLKLPAAPCSSTDRFRVLLYNINRIWLTHWPRESCLYLHLQSEAIV